MAVASPPSVNLPLRHVAHRAFVGEHEDDVRALRAELRAEAPAGQRHEGRIAPLAVRRANRDDAAAAAPAEEEAAADQVRDHGDPARALEDVRRDAVLFVGREQLEDLRGVDELVRVVALRRRRAERQHAEDGEQSQQRRASGLSLTHGALVDRNRKHLN